MYKTYLSRPNTATFLISMADAIKNRLTSAILKRLGSANEIRRQKEVDECPAVAPQLDRRVLSLPSGVTNYSSRKQIISGMYEAKSICVFRSQLRQGMRVLDVGANMGIYTILAASVVGRGGSVIAVEPDPVAISFLKSNVLENGYIDTVTIVERAASNVVGVGHLYSTSGSGRSSLAANRSTRTEHATELEVKTMSIDDLLCGNRVDLTKIDVEGAEISVLEGMSRTIEDAQDHFVMLVEFAPLALRAFGHEPGELIDKLWINNLHIGLIDERQGVVRPVMRSCSADKLATLVNTATGYVNLVACKSYAKLLELTRL